MSDEATTSRPPRSSKAEPTEVSAETVVEPTDTSAPEPVVATIEPETIVVEESDLEPDAPAEERATPEQRVIYIQAPAAPRSLGNRGLGAVIAVLAGLVFAAILAVVTAVIQLVFSGRFSFGFLAEASFYIPALFFIIGFVLLVLIVNRASWWAYIVGSFVVAAVVYFGTVGLGLLSTGIINDTPDEARVRFLAALANPFTIYSAIIAREIAIWTGAILSRRGRKLKVRNAEARDAYDRELAEKMAEHERAGTASATL